jgi:mannosyltransferase
LLYTHYWSTYLLAATALVFAVPALQQRSAARTFARRTLIAVAAGGLMWLPWIPTFLFQADHTSTPWTRAARLGDAASVLRLQAGGKHPAALALASILGAGLLIAAGRTVVAARRTAGTSRWSSPLWMLGGVLVLCPPLAAVGGAISNSAFVGRYSSVVFPLLILLAAIGLVSAGPRRLQASLLAVAALLGLGLGFGESRAARTPATAFATVLQASARPGDVLVFCPDQLGPALSRVIDGTLVAELHQGVYPDWATPQRVDWIDYADRFERGSPDAFAAEADALAGSNAVWLVWSDEYPATQQACAGVAAAMSTLRPRHAEVVADEHSDSDHGALWRFDG